MKIRLIIFLLTIINTTAFGTKTYDLTITVYSLGEKKPLVGFRIACTESKKYSGEETTDENGRVTFHGISEKYLDFKVFDSSGVYQEKTLYYYNPSKESESKEMYLRWTQEKESDFFAKIDEEYTSNNIDIIEQTTNGELLPKGNNLDGFQPASQPGGIVKFYSYLGKTIKYPPVSRQNNVQGTVYLSFLVQPNGQISNVKIVKGIVDELDVEATRAIRYIGSWNPASLNSKPVVAKVMAEVKFKLQ